MSARLILAAAALTLPSLAAAKSKPPVWVAADPVKDKPSITLDPTRAYVLLRSETQVPVLLMRMPDAAEQAHYDELRAAALTEAREKYAKKLASYERTVKNNADARGHGGQQVPLPDRPVEPTAENFQFTAFGLLASAAIGPINRFAKADHLSTYLHALTPGRYRIYGPVAAAPNGAMTGVCFCMGSVSFEARAGEITDLGYISNQVGGEQPAELSPWIKPAPVGMAVDPRLAQATIRPALFQPVGKLPNYFGLQVSRMPEIPGVLRYDRDRIVAP